MRTTITVKGLVTGYPQVLRKGSELFLCYEAATRLLGHTPSRRKSYRLTVSRNRIRGSTSVILRKGLHLWFSGISGLAQGVTFSALQQALRGFNIRRTQSQFFVRLEAE